MSEDYTPADQGWVVPAAMQEVYGKLESLHAAYHHEGPWDECDTCHEIGPCFPIDPEPDSYLGMAYDGIIDIHRRHLEALDRCVTTQAELRMLDRERFDLLADRVKVLASSRERMLSTVWLLVALQVVTGAAALLAIVMAAG